jgi:signal transduction histidine kinase
MVILAEERDQRLTVDAPDRVIVPVDRLVLREAVTNILDNAIKYSPPESTIAVRIKRNAEHAILEIADQGPGVAPEHRKHIFDRFFRLDEGRSRDSGGTGLGLAIAKWAVEVHGGEIAVEDSKVGALFRITLPLTEPTDTRKSQTRSHQLAGGHL